jgi:hypothetical protein
MGMNGGGARHSIRWINAHVMLLFVVGGMCAALSVWQFVYRKYVHRCERQ